MPLLCFLVFVAREHDDIEIMWFRHEDIGYSWSLWDTFHESAKDLVDNTKMDGWRESERSFQTLKHTSEGMESILLYHNFILAAQQYDLVSPKNFDGFHWFP